MGRKVRRVPLDFDWPLNLPWPGFVFAPCVSSFQHEYHLTDRQEACELCRRYARLQGLSFDRHSSCPEYGEPPTGEGWQMWETASGGFPVSPACGSAEELARWLADHKVSAPGSFDTASYAEWLTAIRQGDASRAFLCGGRLVSGVELAARKLVDEVIRALPPTRIRSSPETEENYPKNEKGEDDAS